MSMRYVVSRFERINSDGKDVLVPTQDIGTPYQTRAEAEIKLAQTNKAFEVFIRTGRFSFAIREVDSKQTPEPAQDIQTTAEWVKPWGHPKPKSADGAA